MIFKEGIDLAGMAVARERQTLGVLTWSNLNLGNIAHHEPMFTARSEVAIEAA
jgi:hypothetical protein